MRLIVGLGNPGTRYRGTRHNVGAELIAFLCERAGIALRNRWRLKARTARLPIGGRLVTVAVPRTYMNLSGRAVAALLRWYGCSPADILVVSDDVHLPPGRIRIRRKGGPGGHKGLASIIEALGGEDFARLRIGVGEGRGDRVGHVLGRFSPAERKAVDAALDQAARAVEMIVEKGIDEAMNAFNRSKTGGGHPGGDSPC